MNLKMPSHLPLNQSILERIGETPMIALRNLRPEGGARVLLKIEAENPTGSMKDRMALAMIAAARDLGPEATVVTVMCDTGMKYLGTAQYGDG